MRKAGIIGAGIGGIATAIRLALNNWDVTVFEKNSYAGGKISQIKKKGFRFDTGPSLLTLPDVLEDLFIKSGENMSDYLTIIPLKNSCKYFYEDGTVIRAFNNPKKFAAEVELKSSVQKERILQFLRHSKELFNLTANVFIFNTIHKKRNYLKKNFLKVALKWKKLNSNISMHKANKKWFNDKKIVQLFDRYATYNGSDPYKAPATLNIIPHLEHNIGTYFPSNGMYSIIESLVKLAESLNIQFLYNHKVDKINPHNKNKAVTLSANGKSFHQDIIINNTDIFYFYKNILKENIPSKNNTIEKSSSALIFYWGIKKEFPELHLHNILFSNDYQKEFNYLFKEKNVFMDPTTYIFISSKIVNDDAPKGCENWYVMINVPSGKKINWNKKIPEARKFIIDKINRILKTDIEKHIIFEEILDPTTLENQTSSADGALYGSSSNSKLAAFYRHPNFHKKYKNIFFTGGSVHPGGGIPLCLASANIVYKDIKEIK